MTGLRILAGSAKGRRLRTPPRDTRPSPARLRAALFDALAFVPRGRFLDLYAGSGVVGLEAASRGWDVDLVERSPAAARVLRENARACGLRVRVHVGDALSVAAALVGGVDVAFADPPYELDLEATFQALLDAGPVRTGGRYALQHPSRLVPHLRQAGREASIDTRRYGSNALSFIAACVAPSAAVP
jgi:16S rRNA (guanine966-N2)-methyltransferase